MILYDKCIEYIKNNSDQDTALALKILLLGNKGNKENKKRIITETVKDIPCVLILFDMLHKYFPDYKSKEHLILQDLIKKDKKYESNLELLIVKNIDDIKNFIKDNTLNFYNLLDIQLITDQAGYLAYKEYKPQLKLTDFIEVQPTKNKLNGTAREALNNLLGMKAFVKNNGKSIRNDFTNIIYPISLFSICKTLKNNKLETETVTCDENENYSIRVIEAGLNILGFICCEIENKNRNRFEKYNPNFIGYLINLKDNHWIALRNIPLKDHEWAENYYKLMDPYNNQPIYDEILIPPTKGFDNPEYMQALENESIYNIATLPQGDEINSLRTESNSGHNAFKWVSTGTNPLYETTTRRESHYLESSITLKSFLKANNTKKILAISYLGKFINPNRTLSTEEYLNNK